MSTIIAVTNQKGGVGKTTTSAALLSSLHQRGARVLGIDLDPQGSLGFCLGLDIENCATVYDVMRGDKYIRDVVVSTSIFCRPISCCPARSWSSAARAGNFC